MALVPSNHLPFALIPLERASFPISNAFHIVYRARTRLVLLCQDLARLNLATTRVEPRQIAHLFATVNINNKLVVVTPRTHTHLLTHYGNVPHYRNSFGFLLLFLLGTLSLVTLAEPEKN